ncbi:MAG: DDE-type integrase/transposase/recombinase, partial [Bacteroidota bacterium]
MLRASCKQRSVYEFALFPLHGVGEQRVAVADAVRREEATAEVWHYRLGHPRHRTLETLLADGEGYDIRCQGLKVTERTPAFCEPCVLAKSQRLPISSRTKTSSSGAHPLDLIHIDTVGAVETPSFNGARYAVTITDEASCYRWVLFAKQKTEIANLITEWMSMVENRYDKRVKMVRWDRGTEFRNQTMWRYMRSRGITEQPTPPGVPQLNGKAERSNGVVLSITRTLRISAGFPKAAWAEAMNTAVYLVNRWPQERLGTLSRGGKSATPFEVLEGKKPSLKYLRVFGCMAYVHNRDAAKFDARSRRCRLIGYDHFGYRLAELSAAGHLTGKVTVSRDVLFDERNVMSTSGVPRQSHVNDDERKEEGRGDELAVYEGHEEEKRNEGTGGGRPGTNEWEMEETKNDEGDKETKCHEENESEGKSHSGDAGDERREERIETLRDGGITLRSGHRLTRYTAV